MENFKVKRVKLLDNLGIEVTYYEKVVREDGDYWIEKRIKSTIQRHPDVDRITDDFKIHMVRIFELLAVGMYKPESDMTTQEKKLLKVILERIEVNCITFTGTDEQSRGVILQGRKLVLDDRIAVLTTPNILFNGEYEYISDILHLADNMCNEVFEYIYKKKYAQLNLFAENLVV